MKLSTSISGSDDMIADMPYFMENEAWYYFDYDKRRYELTDKAPKEAIESYEKFYKQLEIYNND